MVLGGRRVSKGVGEEKPGFGCILGLYFSSRLKYKYLIAVIKSAKKLEGG